MLRVWATAAALAASTLPGPSSAAPLPPSSAAPLPPLLYWNASLLAYSRARAAAGDPAFLPAWYHAMADADDAVRQRGNWTVTSRVATPTYPTPQGAGPNSYVSIGFYFWPCTCTAPPTGPGCSGTLSWLSPKALASTAARAPGAAPPACDAATGLPWMDHDGIVNTVAVAAYDLSIAQGFFSAFTDAMFGYALSGNNTYAAAAAGWARVFLLDPATAMLPNMDFGQYVPGVCTGRGTGIIDVSGGPLPGVLDGLLLLRGTPAWSASDDAGAVAWCAALLEWALTSPVAAEEAASTNNHLTWYRALVQGLALYTGNASVAAAFAAGNGARVIDVQIAADGQLPLEEARTRSLHYVSFDLHALVVLARYSALSGVDIWRYVNANGSSIATALNFIAPYALGQEVWNRTQIDPFSYSELWDVFVAGAGALGNATLAAVARDTINNATAADDTRRLAWPWPWP